MMEWSFCLCVWVTALAHPMVCVCGRGQASTKRCHMVRICFSFGKSNNNVLGMFSVCSLFATQIKPSQNVAGMFCLFFVLFFFNILKSIRTLEHYPMVICSIFMNYTKCSIGYFKFIFIIMSTNFSYLNI